MLKRDMIYTVVRTCDDNIWFVKDFNELLAVCCTWYRRVLGLSYSLAFEFFPLIYLSRTMQPAGLES
jgi:hypothetical protein